jgi:hypothetical protein
VAFNGQQIVIVWVLRWVTCYGQRQYTLLSHGTGVPLSWLGLAKVLSSYFALARLIALIWAWIAFLPRRTQLS